MRKRICSFVLSLCMLLALLPVSASAAVVDSGTCGATGDGSNLTWTLDDTGLLTISGTGVMKAYSSSPSPWGTSISSALIKEGVTSIGAYAFQGCNSLTNITISEGVTYIGNDAFSDCKGLTNITIPESVTSIGSNAFSDCSNLSSITIMDGVTSIEGYAFSGCSSLTSFTVPESVTSVGMGVFYGCSGLTSVTLSSRITNIRDRMFEGCRKLTEITFSDNLTYIGGHAFRGCIGLTNIVLPDSLTAIKEGAFSGCSGLTSMIIPDGVTYIEAYTFILCSGLTSVTIPEKVTTIQNYAFASCSGLTSITIPTGVKTIYGASFSGCSGLTSITIPDGVTSIQNLAFEECTSLTSIAIPESVTSISSNAFSGCSSLNNVYFWGNEEAWNNISISSTGNNNLTTSSTLYYPGPANITFPAASEISTVNPTVTITSDRAFAPILARSFPASITVDSNDTGLTPQSAALDPNDPENKTLNLTFSGTSKGGNLPITIDSSAFAGPLNFTSTNVVNVAMPAATNDDPIEYAYRVVGHYSTVNNGVTTETGTRELVPLTRTTGLSYTAVPDASWTAYSGTDGGYVYQPGTEAVTFTIPYEAGNDSTVHVLHLYYQKDITPAAPSGPSKSSDSTSAFRPKPKPDPEPRPEAVSPIQDALRNETGIPNWIDRLELPEYAQKLYHVISGRPIGPYTVKQGSAFEIEENFRLSPPALGRPLPAWSSSKSRSSVCWTFTPAGRTIR